MYAAKAAVFCEYFVQARESALPDTEAMIGSLQSQTGRNRFGITVEDEDVTADAFETFLTLPAYDELVELFGSVGPRH